MIYVFDRDHRGYQESSRAELEAAIPDSGYQYDLSDSPLSEVKAIADSRGLDYFCWSKAEAYSIVRYYRSLRGGKD